MSPCYDEYEINKTNKAYKPHIIMGIWPRSFYPVTVNDWTMRESDALDPLCPFLSV